MKLLVTLLYSHLLWKYFSTDTATVICAGVCFLRKNRKKMGYSFQIKSLITISDKSPLECLYSYHSEKI